MTGRRKRRARRRQGLMTARVLMQRLLADGLMTPLGLIRLKRLGRLQDRYAFSLAELGFTVIEVGGDG